MDLIPTLKSSSGIFSSRAEIELNGSIRGRLGAGMWQWRSTLRRTDSEAIGGIFSALYTRSLLSVVDVTVVFDVVAVDFFAIS